MSCFYSVNGSYSCNEGFQITKPKKPCWITGCPKGQCCNSKGKCGGSLGTYDYQYCIIPKDVEIAKAYSFKGNEFIVNNEKKSYDGVIFVNPTYNGCGPVSRSSCPDNQCCNVHNTCGGKVGVYDNKWCTSSTGNPKTFRGINNGQYDGIADITSKDGKCGPKYNNKICPYGQCCNSKGECGGLLGTESIWCSTKYISELDRVDRSYIGVMGGKYDGK